MNNDPVSDSSSDENTSLDSDLETSPPATQDPDPEAPNQGSTNPASTATKKTSGGRIGTVLGILNLILILALAGLGYWAWVNQTKQQQATGQNLEARLDTGLQNLNRENGRLEEGMNGRLDALNRQQKRLSDQQSGIQEGLDQVRIFSVRGTAGWVLAEVEYLLRIANHRLQLQHDPKVATIALRTADDRLRTLADPGLTPVREQLAREITALGNLPDLDIEGLALTLESLASQVTDLPLPNTMLDGEKASPEPSKVDPNAEGLDKFVQVTIEHVGGLFRLRTHDQPVEALLTPKERYFLYQNLRLRLNSARLHLLERNDSALKSDLDAAQKLLNKHFDLRHQGVKNSLSELQRIAGLSIDPTLPDISGSLAALRLVMAELAQKRPSPTPPTPNASVSPAPAAVPTTPQAPQTGIAQ